MADKFNIKLDYNNHEQLIENIFKKHPEIEKVNSIISANWTNIKPENSNIKGSENNYFLENYYQTCPITRASSNMANCKKDLAQEEINF